MLSIQCCSPNYYHLCLVWQKTTKKVFLTLCHTSFNQHYSANTHTQAFILFSNPGVCQDVCFVFCTNINARSFFFFCLNVVTLQMLWCPDARCLLAPLCLLFLQSAVCTPTGPWFIAVLFIRCRGQMGLHRGWLVGQTYHLNQSEQSSDLRWK